MEVEIVKPLVILSPSSKKATKHSKAELKRMRLNTIKWVETQRQAGIEVSDELTQYVEDLKNLIK